MHPINDKRILRVILQGWFENFDVIEMEFTGVQRLNMFLDEICSCEILDVTMILKDDRIYWCDCWGISETDMETYEGVMICASKLKWRAADEYIGEEEVYINR